MGLGCCLGHGPVESYDRSRGQNLQCGVKHLDLGLVCLVGPRSRTVNRGYRRLNLERPGLAMKKRLPDKNPALAYLLVIPERSILVLQQYKSSRLVDPGIRPRVLEQGTVPAAPSIPPVPETAPARAGPAETPPRTGAPDMNIASRRQNSPR